MSEVLEKLRPDRDLQSYFFRPSAIAALSEASPSGFTVSGCWRQQFDWAVVEWNRDDVFEHPSMRPLPDGDLSGLTLSYIEQRTNCIPIDSPLYPTVDWPYLRIWADDGLGEAIYRVSLKDHATPESGNYEAASATFVLSGSPTAGDVVELSWRDEHYSHTIQSGDGFADVLSALASNINSLSTSVTATFSVTEAAITLTNAVPGAAGNRLGIVASVSGVETEVWTPSAQLMSGGTSPSAWRVDLDFGSLVDKDSQPVPTHAVRKMRWTYSADLQDAAYERSEFAVVVSGWTVTGSNRLYSVAGPGSRRYEDHDPAISYGGVWTSSTGNFSGGSIHRAVDVGCTVALSYEAEQAHRLFLGVRRTFEAARIDVRVDGGVAQSFGLFLPGEDVLARLDLGALASGSHTVAAELVGSNPASSGSSFYFDFLETAAPTTSIEPFPSESDLTLATDWDTDHSVVIAPERVAWNMDFLGFHGRANHYVGAILFYELHCPGNAYASGTVTFSGVPVFSQTVQITIDGTAFQRLTLSTDSAEGIAKAFEFLINEGSTGVWAEATSNVLTVWARALGTAGSALALSASPAAGPFTAVADGSNLSGGIDGQWRTDTTASPRLNRAARDWHRAYFAAMQARGVEVTTAFSTELSHGDPSPAAGIAQRYPDGGAVLLNTPAIQTNFSPASIDYWRDVYVEAAGLQAEVGMTPSLQFGEVQWWYFPNGSVMAFYDDYTTVEFQNRYGRAMHVFASNEDSLDGWDEEREFLPALIGQYTSAIRTYVRGVFPDARFEVLYPHDVNDFALTRVVNYPDDWNPANLNTLKTENFLHTGARNMNSALLSIRLPFEKGFPRGRSAHLIGVFNSAEPWDLERRLAQREGVESVVFWAFDQFLMIGYRLPLPVPTDRALFYR